MPLKYVTLEDPMIINEITSKSTCCEKNISWKQMAASIKHIKTYKKMKIILEFSHT